MLSLFKKKYSKSELELLDFLGGIAQFEGLSNEELNYFVPFMHLRTYNQNEIVFFSGDPSQAFYIVRKGNISLSIDIKERSEELLVLDSRMAFGDNTFLNGSKRLYNATVVSESAELYVLPHINLMEILDAHSEVKAKVFYNIMKINNSYTTNIFKMYKASYGFFELSSVYRSKK